MLLESNFWFQFIPSCEVNIYDSIKKSNIDLIIKPGSFYNFKKNKYNSNIFQVRKADGYIEDIIAYCGYLLEKKRQRKCIYSIHGTLIGRKGIGIGFVGGISGLGKTTVANYFCQDANGWFFLGDEKFLIDTKSMKAYGGINNFTENDKLDLSLKKHKIKKSLLQIDIDIEIKLLIIPILTNNKGNKNVFEYSKYQKIWLLYEEFTRDIRLLNGLVDGFSKNISSLDTKIIAKNRIKEVTKISDEIKIFYIMGTKEEIYEKSIDILSNSST